VLAWYRKVQLHHESQLPAKALGYPEKDWYEWVEEVDDEGRRKRQRVERFVGTRESRCWPATRRRGGWTCRSSRAATRGRSRWWASRWPSRGTTWSRSSRDGWANRCWTSKAPMYVRTGVLVTNLGVHFKQGRENAVVWVTTLDRGRPVADAEVAINDCRGGRVWAGRTNADGLATWRSR
jgi:hypothetical protein